MKSKKTLGHLLGQTMHIYKQRMVSEMRKNNIELGLEQFFILHQLKTEEKVIQQDLANHLMKDKSFILRLINTLMDNGYVTRLSDKDDKRKKNLSLTHQGSELLKQIYAIGEKISNELLAGINPEELIIFEQVINQIKKNSGLEEE